MEPVQIEPAVLSKEKTMTAYLEFKNITKDFPGVRALKDVSLSIMPGSVHGLVGENGAGKSTLLKILSGAHPQTTGDIIVGGEVQHYSCPKDAIDSGTTVIYQELNLVPDMTVAENLMLGHLPVKKGLVDKRELNRISSKQLEYLMEKIDPNTKVKNLPIAQRQMIEIGKALLHNAKVIAFDEPTSSLSEKETVQLFSIINNLKEQGCSIIYVSHRLKEIFEICDALTIFRDGEKIITYDDMSGVGHDEVVSKMVGRNIDDIYGYKGRPIGEPSVLVDGMTGLGVPEPVSFNVNRGEILGFFGLVGAGRSELMRLIYGQNRKKDGSLTVNGRKVEITSPAAALDEGIVFCPEDRKAEGIISIRDVNENINISVRKKFLHAGFFLNKKKEKENAAEFVETLRIKTPSLEQRVGNLSGGNQQKVILARNLSMPTELIILDEPTRGIDVGTKSEIYRLMYELAEQGKSIIFVSSELPEILGVSDRILVMRDGKIVKEIGRKEASEESVLHYALPEFEDEKDAKGERK